MELTNDYFDLFDQTVKISDNETLCLKRLNDGTVLVSIDDEVTGTLTKLAYYKGGRWSGYNAPNYNKLFSLFRKYTSLKPKLIRFLTPNDHLPEVRKVTKVVNCARRRFTISVKSASRSVKHNLHEKIHHTNSACTNMWNRIQA